MIKDKMRSADLLSPYSQQSRYFTKIIYLRIDAFPIMNLITVHILGNGRRIVSHLG